VWDYNHPEHLSIDAHGGHQAAPREPVGVGSSSVRIVSPDHGSDGVTGGGAE
jgi:hypothetical protein